MDKQLKHVALIMDGNRRWAEEMGLSRFGGHSEGEQRIQPIVDRAIELEIPYLTFWAFAIKNWRRSEEEVNVLLDLFREGLAEEVDKFHRKSVRVNVIGNLDLFPEDIQEQTGEWIEKTKDNDKVTVNIALSYGGRDEIIRAINKILESRIKNQESSMAGNKQNKDLLITHHSSLVTEEEFAQYLDTAGQPDPDLLIRTGRQRRLSGFLPWQTTYTELYFTDVLWPDFTVEEFDKAIEWFKEQKRNFGK